MKKEFRMYLIIFTLTLVFGLQRILTYNVGYDTAEFLFCKENSIDTFYGSGRILLGLLKSLYDINNLHIINLFTYINIGIYSCLFIYFINLGKEEVSYKKSCLIGILFISTPIFLEQYYFTLQAMEISFCMILMTLSYIATYYLLRDKKIFLAPVILVLCFICFGMYQAFTNLYVVGAVMCLYKLNKEASKENIKSIITVLLLWLSSLILYILALGFVRDAVAVEANNYLAIGWAENSLPENLFTIAASIGKVVLGYGHVFNLSFTICLVYILYSIVKSEKKISWKHFFLLALLVTPFLLNIATATMLIERVALGIPFVCALFFDQFMDKSKAMKTAFFIVIASQIIHTQLILLSDNMRYTHDLKMTEKIYQDCHADESTHLVFVGVEKTSENQFNLEGDIIGASFFQWSSGQPNVAVASTYFFMQLHNYPYTIPTPEEVQYGYSLTFEAEYPEDGYIIEENGCYYINLGK